MLPDSSGLQCAKVHKHSRSAAQITKVLAICACNQTIFHCHTQALWSCEVTQQLLHGFEGQPLYKKCQLI